jgi:hypothetical protein
MMILLIFKFSVFPSRVDGACKGERALRPFLDLFAARAYFSDNQSISAWHLVFLWMGGLGGNLSFYKKKDNPPGTLP